MRRGTIGALTGTLWLLGATAATAAAQRWIHVHIDEENGSGARVTLNLPIGLIDAALPLVPRAGKFGDGHIRINGEDLDNQHLRALWAALREAQDAPYATVEQRDESVRIEKSRGFMLINVTPKTARGERVTMRVPLPVVDALLSGADDELDLEAAVRALADSGAVGELVVVDDDATTVRIWIDDRSESR